MKNRRFPGINPFQTHEQDRFFGRDDDIRELHALIALEKTVVVFGKSGHGKSSLLNAGIVPRLLAEKSERRHLPVVIKFGAHVEGRTPPAEAARQFLEKDLPTADRDFSIFEKIKNLPPTLWQVAKTSGQRRVCLIFDQFEEFFTYPLPQQQRFADELGELLNADLPESLAARFADFAEAEQDFLAEKMDVKAVFAIREDRLHLLDKLKYPLPAIFARRFPLLPLPRAQASEALTRPAGLPQGADFEVPPFEFSTEALEKILDYLADAEGRVETNQLQILAESFEKRAETEQIRRFDPQNLGVLKKIVADYYREKIAALPNPADQLAARRLCEEGLAQESEPPVRLNLHESQIRSFFKIEPALLETLVQNRLLRAEPGAGGGYTYELPHDTLLEPVLDAKRERLEADARQREKDAAEAAERRAREAEAQAAVERRRRQRATMLAVAASVGLVLALVGMLWAFAAQRQAEKAEREAQERLDAFLVEKQAREAAETINRQKQIEGLKEKIDNFIEGGADDLARDSMQILEKLAPNDPDILKLKNRIK